MNILTNEQDIMQMARDERCSGYTAELLVQDLNKLISLREAGEKMAKAIKPFNNVTDIEGQDEEQYLYDQFQTLTRADFYNLFAALAEWEAANK